MAVGLFISENYLKDNTVIDENVDMQLLLPTIWMAQEQRSSFISVIRNNNGNFGALLGHIESQIGEATQ